MAFRRLLSALAALATAAPVAAAAQQASAELGMLVAGQTSHGEQASFGAFDLRLEAGWLRDSPPAEERGLSLQAGEECCFFIYVGVEPDDFEGIYLSLDGEVGYEGAPEDHVSGTHAVFEQRAGLRWAGWGVEQREAYQRTPSFGAAFWRPGRGVRETGLTLDIPPMYGFGRTGKLFWVFPIQVRYTSLDRHDGGELGGREFDVGVDIVGAGLDIGRFSGDLFGFHFREYGVPLSSDGDTTFGVSVTTFDFDFAHLSWKLRPDLVLSGRSGLALRGAMAPFESNVGPTGGSSSSYGEPVGAGAFWIDLAYGDRDRDGNLTGDGFSLGGGTLYRVDPTGYAVDAGGRGAIDGALAVSDDVHLSLEASLAFLERVKISEIAPAGIVEPEGTRMWMSQVAGVVSWNLGQRWRASGRAWAERSDRDDPRWSAIAPGAVRSRYGLELSLSTALSRGR